MVYLDYNATTPVLPEVYEAMRPYFCEEWGNPSSAYRFGSKHKRTIEIARESVADLIGADPDEILFTSCATESNNSAILAALAIDPSKRHIITSAIEHSSVLTHFDKLGSAGYRVTYLPVDRDGVLKLDSLKDSLTAETAVVSLWTLGRHTPRPFGIEDIGRNTKCGVERTPKAPFGQYHEHRFSWC